MLTPGNENIHFSASFSGSCHTKLKTLPGLVIRKAKFGGEGGAVKKLRREIDEPNRLAGVDCLHSRAEMQPARRMASMKWATEKKRNGDKSIGRL